MIVCPYRFDDPDPKDPTYSFLEIDRYAWIPMKHKIPNHRLSLRKNLITGKYEVYRQYVDTEVVRTPNYVAIMNKDGKYEEVILATTSLQEALNCTNEQYQLFHKDSDIDEVCNKTTKIDWLCDRSCKVETTTKM